MKNTALCTFLWLSIFMLGGVGLFEAMQVAASGTVHP